MKLIYAILSLVMLNIALYVQQGNATVTRPQLNSITEIEIITDDEECHAGGPGAIECKVGAVASIDGIRVGGNCGVTCGDDYYACCGFHCRCVLKNT